MRTGRLCLIIFLSFACINGVRAERSVSTVYWARGTGGMYASLIISNICATSQTITVKFRAETGHSLANLAGSPSNITLTCSTGTTYDTCVTAASSLASSSLMRVQAITQAADTPVAVTISVTEDDGCIIANLKTDPTVGTAYSESRDLNSGRPF